MTEVVNFVFCEFDLNFFFYLKIAFKGVPHWVETAKL